MRHRRVAGHHAIANFICPMEQTRLAFGPAFVTWVNRIAASIFADTNEIFGPPHHLNIRLRDGSVTEWA
jgi:hypothetical protein